MAEKQFVSKSRPLPSSSGSRRSSTPKQKKFCRGLRASAGAEDDKINRNRIDSISNSNLNLMFETNSDAEASGIEVHDLPEDISIITPDGKTVKLSGNSAAQQLIIDTFLNTSGGRQEDDGRNEHDAPGAMHEDDTPASDDANAVDLAKLHGMLNTMSTNYTRDMTAVRAELSLARKENESLARTVAELKEEQNGEKRRQSGRPLVPKQVRDAVNHAHKVIDLQYRGGENEHFRSPHNRGVTEVIEKLVIEKLPLLPRTVLNAACQRRYESFVRGARETEKEKAERKVCARRRELLARRKKYLKTDESLLGVTAAFMSDEEDGLEDGRKIFIRRSPRWRAQGLTILLRGLDLRHERATAGARPPIPRKYGEPSTRPAPAGCSDARLVRVTS